MLYFYVCNPIIPKLTSVIFVVSKNNDYLSHQNAKAEYQCSCLWFSWKTNRIYSAELQSCLYCPQLKYTCTFGILSWSTRVRTFAILFLYYKHLNFRLLVKQEKMMLLAINCSKLMKVPVAMTRPAFCKWFFRLLVLGLFLADCLAMSFVLVYCAIYMELLWSSERPLVLSAVASVPFLCLYYTTSK